MSRTRSSRMSDTSSTAAMIDVVTVKVEVIVGWPPRFWLIAIATPVVADFGSSESVTVCGNPNSRP